MLIISKMVGCEEQEWPQAGRAGKAEQGREGQGCTGVV